MDKDRAAATIEPRGSVVTPTCERTHPVHWFAGRLGEVLDGLLGVDGQAGLALGLLDEEQTAEAVVEVHRSIARLQGLEAALLAHAGVVEVGSHAVPVATSTSTWFAHATRTPAPEARPALQHAERLAGERAATGAALRAGACDAAQATVVVKAVDGLPSEVGPELRAKAEAHLLDLARLHDAQTLKKLAAHLHEVIDPDSADAALAAKLAAEEQAAHEAATCRVRDTANGRTKVVIDLPRLHGDVFRSILHAIESPKRPANQRGEKAGDQVNGGPGEPGEPDGRSGSLLGRDEGWVDDPTNAGRKLTRDQARGRAFCELLERIPVKALPSTGGSPFTVVVTMTLESLLGGLEPGVLDTGTQISAGDARRLAAAHGVIPVVLGTKSEVLDVGRKARFHTKAMRIALRVQHKTCTADGCTIPAAWCHAHHKDAWALGGHTNLKDGTLLCGGHHRKVHHPAYTTTYDPAGTTHITRIRR